MAISLQCPGCRSSLKLGDGLAGAKVKCPRCQKFVHVPEAEDEDYELVECTVEDEERVRQGPRRKTGHTGRVQREQPPSRRKEGIRIGRHRDEEEQVEEGPRRQGGKKGKKADKFKPCPECGAGGATRVKWTAWGSFYGPALFTHVRCPECSYCYNGKTGRSNILAAIIFVAMPLLGILGILAAILYIVMQRGHMG